MAGVPGVPGVSASAPAALPAPACAPVSDTAATATQEALLELNDSDEELVRQGSTSPSQLEPLPRAMHTTVAPVPSPEQDRGIDVPIPVHVLAEQAQGEDEDKKQEQEVEEQQQQQQQQHDDEEEDKDVTIKVGPSDKLIGAQLNQHEVQTEATVAASATTTKRLQSLRSRSIEY